MQKNRYHWILSDVKSYHHWILSDVNIIRCRKTADCLNFHQMLAIIRYYQVPKTAIIEFIRYLSEFCLMLYHQMQKNSYQWILSEYHQMKNRLTEFYLMLISSDAEKQLKFCLWSYHHQNFVSDVNIIRCQKTGIIEFCLMLISSDAVKRDTMEISLMLISSDAANRCHWILSDVNVVRCRKAAINECHEMLTSSDAEKSCHEILTAFTDTGQQLSINILWC